MMWYLWRGKLWMARNRWQNQPLVARFFTLLLLAGVLGGIWGGYRYLVGRFSEMGAALRLLSPLVFVGAALPFLLTLVFESRAVFCAFYTASDLSLLRAAPIPPVTIFAVKTIESSQLVLLPLTLGGMVLLAYGQASHSGWGFRLWALGILCGMALVTVALSLAVVFLAIRFFNPRRARGFILGGAVLISLAALCLWLPFTYKSSDFFAALLRFWGALQSHSITLTPGAPAGTLMAGAVLIGLDYWLYRRLFYYGWARVHEVPIQLEQTPKHLHFLERWSRSLPGLPCRHMVAKEWLSWARSPRRLIYLLGLPLNGVWILLLYFSKSSVLAVMSWILFVLLFILISLAVATWAIDLMAGEGRNWALLRVMPVSMKDVLRGKFWGLFLPALVSVEVVALGASPMVGWSWKTLLITFLITAYLVLSFAASGIAVGSLAANVRSNEPAQAVGCWGLPVALLMSLLLVGLTVLSGFWGLDYLTTAERLPPWWQGLRSFSILNWLVRLRLWALFIFAGAHALFWLLVRGIWRAGARRLERMEVTGV